MEISKYHRQQRLSGSAGNVLARPSNPAAGLEQIGNTMTQFGFALAKQELQAQYNDQMQNASLEVDKAYEEYFKGLNPDNTDEWEPNLDKTHEGLDPTLKKILTNGKAQADFSPVLERRKFDQKKNLTDYRMSVNAGNYRRNYYRNYNEAQEITANQSIPGGYDRHALDFLDITYGLQLKKDVQLSEELIDITPENVDKYFETKEGYESPIFDSIEQRTSEAKRWLRGSKELYDKNQNEILLKSHLNIALNMPAGGEAYIRGLDLPTAEKRKLVSDYDFETARAKQQDDAAINKGEQAIQDRLYIQKDFTDIIEFIDTQLPASAVDEREHWYDKANSMAKAALKGPAESNDPEALMSANEIVRKVRNREITPRQGFSEIVPLFPKLTDEKRDSLIPQIVAAEKPKEDPTNGHQFKTYMGMIGNVFSDKNGLIASKAAKWDAAITEFEDWWIANPEASPQQRQEKYEQVIEQEVRGFFEKWWGRAKWLAIGNLAEAGKATKGKTTFTDEDYAALKSGDEFTDPETGKKYRKP